MPTVDGGLWLGAVNPLCLRAKVKIWEIIQNGNIVGQWQVEADWLRLPGCYQGHLVVSLTPDVESLLSAAAAPNPNEDQYLLTASGTSPPRRPSGRTGPASCLFRWRRDACAPAASRCGRRRTPVWRCGGPRRSLRTCGGRGGPWPTRICRSDYRGNAEQMGQINAWGGGAVNQRTQTLLPLTSEREKWLNSVWSLPTTELVHN